MCVCVFLFICLLHLSHIFLSSDPSSESSLRYKNLPPADPLARNKPAWCLPSSSLKSVSCVMLRGWWGPGPLQTLPHHPSTPLPGGLRFGGLLLLERQLLCFHPIQTDLLCVLDSRGPLQAQGVELTLDTWFLCCNSPCQAHSPVPLTCRRRVVSRASVAILMLLSSWSHFSTLLVKLWGDVRARGGSCWCSPLCLFSSIEMSSPHKHQF